MKKYKTGYFDIDHPVLSVLSVIGVYLGGCIGILVIFFISVILLMLVCPINNCYEGSKIFEYEDLNGNIGTASDCQYTDKESRSGGMGEPICFVGNKVIAVKWYEDKTQYKSCKEIILGGK